MSQVNCPLCLSKKERDLFAKVQKRPFYRCSYCDLIFQDPKTLLSQEDEVARYLTHQNSIEDEDYLNFLKRLQAPMAKILPTKSEGLDYGAGPVKAMEWLWKQDGQSCLSYDPYFFPSKEYLLKQYDFITCSETFEHFYRPQKELELLSSSLRSQGLLGIMTRKWQDQGDFSTWFYVKDPTHVSIYTSRTFQWIAEEFCFDFEFENETVVILKKGKS